MNVGGCLDNREMLLLYHLIVRFTSLRFEAGFVIPITHRRIIDQTFDCQTRRVRWATSVDVRVACLTWSTNYRRKARCDRLH